MPDRLKHVKNHCRNYLEGAISSDEFRRAMIILFDEMTDKDMAAIAVILSEELFPGE